MMMRTRGNAGGSEAAHGAPGFRNYRPEEEACVRKAGVGGDKLSTTLANIWGSVSMPWMQPHSGDILGAYSRFTENIDRLAMAPSARDVEAISLLIGCLSSERWFGIKAGLLLSALVEKGVGDSFVIRTHDIEPPHYLGYMNRKRVVVEGDAGDRTGYMMRGDGEITVCGDARDELGMNMGSGKLIVLGNAGDSVGMSMGGGEIHLGGGFSSILMVLGGRIYCGGRLIVDK